MRRFLVSAVLALAAAALAVSIAWAGNPHFVGQISVVRTDSSITVSGKEAGLGNETQVHIEVTADALCINRGKKHPKADNKEDLAAGEDVPVQNGKANFSITLTATIEPPCDPPMTLVFTNIVVTDTDHGISKSVPGTF